MRRARRILGWAATVIAVAAVVGWSLLFSPLDAVGYEDAACEGCARLEERDLVVPANGTTGLIVYTGARVVPEAYAPVAERIAAAGHPVFVPRLTLNFAVFDAAAADAVIAEHPEIENWVIAGHSLGGVMAARYAAEHPEIDGLVLWGSYPEESLDLTGTDLVVSSIYASEDGLSTPGEVLAAADNLPRDAVFIEIEGGNHAQFGDYGPQRGDGTATIAPEAQWDQVAKATIAVLDTVDGHLTRAGGCQDVTIWWMADDATEAVVLYFEPIIETVATGDRWEETFAVGEGLVEAGYLRGTYLDAWFCNDTAGAVIDEEISATRGEVTLVLRGSLEVDFADDPDRRVWADVSVQNLRFPGRPPLDLSAQNIRVGWFPG